MKKSLALTRVLVFVVIGLGFGLLNWWQKATFEKRLIAAAQDMITNIKSSSGVIEELDKAWASAISGGTNFSAMMELFSAKHKDSLEALERVNSAIEKQMLYLRMYPFKNKEAYSTVADLYMKYSQIYYLVKFPYGTLMSFREESNKLKTEFPKLLTKVKLEIPELGEAAIKAKEEALVLREQKARKAQEEAEKLKRAEEEAERQRQAQLEAERQRQTQEETEKKRKAQEEALKKRRAREEAKRKAQEEAEKKRKTFEEVKKEKEETVRGQLLKVKALYESGQEKEALDIYASVLGLEASLPQNMYLYLGKIYNYSNKWDEAIIAYKKVLDLDKKDISTCLDLVTIFERLEKYDDAVEFLKMAFKIKPNLNTVDRIVKLYTKLNKYDHSIATYKEAIAALPGKITLFEKLGLLYYSLHRYDEAIESFKKALAIADPKQYRIFRNYIGNCYYYKKEYGKAIEEYREAVYLNRQNKEFNFNLGRVLVDNNSYEDGIYWLNLAKGLGRQDAYLYYYLGKGYSGVGNLKTAEKAFTKAIERCNDITLKENIQKALGEVQSLKLKPGKSISEFLGGK